MFKELNVLTCRADVVGPLEAALDDLFAAGEVLTEPPRYRPAMAAIEERLG